MKATVAKRAAGGSAFSEAHKVTPREKGEYARGGRLTTAERKKIPGDDFALPGRRYPIENPSHARNALARVSQFGTPEEKSKVRAAVHRKYPKIGK